MLTNSSIKSILYSALLLVSALPVAAKSAAPVWPYANETGQQRDERMEWWRDARFGMFIHWGVYAVPAGTYNGQQIPSLGEWIMFNAKIPVAAYAGYPKQF